MSDMRPAYGQRHDWRGGISSWETFIGIDIDPKMVEIAKQRMGLNGEDK